MPSLNIWKDLPADPSRVAQIQDGCARENIERLNMGKEFTICLWKKFDTELKLLQNGLKFFQFSSNLKNLPIKKAKLYF